MKGDYVNLSQEGVIACKRCGRQPKVMAGGVDGKVKYVVTCARCDKASDWTDTREQAILEWNYWQTKIPNIVVKRIMGAVKEMEYCNLDHDWLREEVVVIVNEYIGATTQ